MTPLGICVIGAGDLGATQAESWLKVPEVRLVSVADPDIVRCRSSQVKYGFDSWHEDYREALAQPGIDVVSVVVPSDLRRECAEAAMGRGYHVLCANPLAVSIEDAESMIASRDRAGVKLGVGLCRRYLGQVLKTRELIQAEALGRPCVYRYVSGGERLHRLWVMDKYSGGGPVIDLCSRYFDEMRFIFGSEPVRVRASGLTLSEGAGEMSGADLATDTVNLIVGFASGDIGVMSITWGLPQGVETGALEDVLGSRGVIRLDNPTEVTLVTKRGHEEKFTGLEADAQLRQLEAFAQAIREDLPIPFSAEDGLTALRVSHAVLASVRTGQAVDLA
ncbi:Gfo/Idh/MocA family oxidoreductase [bacterium]|nr:Gfo/Idh/MocA family oxidoreductase [bacterium]